MTCNEAKIKVLDYLSQNDSINFEQLNKLLDTSCDKTEGLSAVLGALQELSSDGVVFLNPLADISKPTTLLWVLKQKLYSRQQNVVINGEIAEQISNIVNSFAEAANSDEVICNQLQIEEKDILILLSILGNYIEQNEKDSELPPEPAKYKKNKD